MMIKLADFGGGQKLGAFLEYVRAQVGEDVQQRIDKLFWGLEDFMSFGKTAVTNAANFAFFMVTVPQVLLSLFVNLTLILVLQTSRHCSEVINMLRRL